MAHPNYGTATWASTTSLRQRYLSSWCLEGVESFLGVASLLTLGSLLVGVGSRLSALSCPALREEQTYPKCISKTSSTTSSEENQSYIHHANGKQNSCNANWEVA